MSDQDKIDDYRQLQHNLQTASTKEQVIKLYVAHAAEDMNSRQRLEDIDQKIIDLQKQKQLLQGNQRLDLMGSIRSIAAERLLELELGEDDD